MAGWVLLKIVYLLMRWLFGLTVLVFRGDQARDAELLVLRHENAVLRRQTDRVRYEPGDRAWFAALARFIPRRCWAEVFPVTPATLLAWHRQLAARRQKVRHEQTPQARPACDDPEHRPPGRSAGEREPAVGIPPDPRRTDEAGNRRRPVDRP